MAWGFFKKVVVADRLAPMVNTVYADPTQYSGIPLIAATYAFAFQIYCDFSGYSDIAIGAARILGIDLMENFRQPYHARSIPEFWQRWHISLSTWFRDYVYIPLGGNRVALLRWCLNVMIVFVVSGLWHGANWTFLVWGALHGFYVLAGRGWSAVTRNRAWGSLVPSSVRRGLEMVWTFHLVVFAWIFFRANSLSDALYVVTHLFDGLTLNMAGYGIMPGGVYEMSIALLALLILEAVHVMQARTEGFGAFLRRQPSWVTWPAYLSVCTVIIAFGKFGLQEFIYFQF
jgi:D-alanyl-lipoteichoic acid acyltransferase DltB (MBOAT superfamily)